MSVILRSISDAVWGLPTVILILGSGIFLTFKLGFPQITRFKEMLRSAGGDSKPGGISPFQSLATSLSATVGTGSVVGVAAAIYMGGPGALFWMWVSAFFGMAVAYAEGYLSIKYRRVSLDGSRTGGIWFTLKDRMNAPKIAAAHAGLCILTSFGMGSMAQTASAAEALNREFSVDPAICGIFCAGLIGVCLFGGKKFTAALCGGLMPILSGLYIVGAAAVILKNINALPGAIKDILDSALGLRAAAGGAAGSAILRAAEICCRRGVFSNEAGLGTTAPVHAASSVDDPDRQGLMNMLEVTVDTFVICTLTGLAILCSGNSGLDGVSAIVKSAEGVFGGAAAKAVAICIAGFAVATAVGWSQIGSAAAEYLFKGKGRGYRAALIAAAFIGAAAAPSAVWQISDIFNGLTVLPCMTAVLGSGERMEDRR